MSDTIPASEDTSKPKRPAKSFNPNRRAMPSELRNTIKALQKALKKEEKRAEVMRDLSKQIEDLAGKLSSLRSAHLNR